MEQFAKLKWTHHLAPVLQIVQKILKSIALAYIYQLARYGGLMSCGSKDIFKNAPNLRYNSHHDFTDLADEEMVKNTKT